MLVLHAAHQGLRVIGFHSIQDHSSLLVLVTPWTGNTSGMVPYPYLIQGNGSERLLTISIPQLACLPAGTLCLLAHLLW